jgi:hypothetical protein
MKRPKRISAKDVSITWDAAKDNCMLRHKSGKGGDLGSGVTDVISVYGIGSNIAALSVNYPARYACLEVFSKSGLTESVFAGPKDIQKMFGPKFGTTTPEAIASRLSSELPSAK